MLQVEQMVRTVAVKLSLSGGELEFNLVEMGEELLASSVRIGIGADSKPLGRQVMLDGRSGWATDQGQLEGP